MSLPTQGYACKRPGLKKSKSQGWAWPHLVSVQANKPATSSLHTPDEQNETSPMTEEKSRHQCSPPRSPASSTTGSVIISRKAIVLENQNTQQDRSKFKSDTEEIAPPVEGSSQHGKDASFPPAEEEAPSHHTDDNDQNADDDNKIVTEPEKVDEVASRTDDERVDNLTPAPRSESNRDHGEESSQSSPDVTADAEEHAAHHGGANISPESSESKIEEQTNANATNNKPPFISDAPDRKVESQNDSPKTEAVVPPNIIQIGEELSRMDSPVIIRDFGTPSLKEDTASLKQASTPPPPRIFVQRASDATGRSTPFPMPAAAGSEEQPCEPYPSEESERSSGQSHGADPLASRIAIPPEITSNLSHDTEDPEKPKVKKRKLVVRKSRNVMMRKHFLQVMLGRQLAEHTKPALRLLAHGEALEVEIAAAGERNPMLHMSDDSTLSLPSHGH